MKGYLQYAEAGIGPYINIATLRIRDEKQYSIKAVTDEDRLGGDATVAFAVEVNATSLNIDEDFLAQLDWYFRIYFPDDNTEIRLGERNYQPGFDATLQRNTYAKFIVKLKFLIDPADFIFYVTGIDAGAEPTMSAMIEDLDQGHSIFV